MLPRLRVGPDPRQRGMFFSIVEACTFNIWASAVGGNYLTGMALYLGAGGLALGILGALPSFSTMLQLVSAPFVVGLQNRRNFLAVFSGLQRFCGALAGLVALLLMPSKVALVVFVAMHVLAWAFMAPSTVVWQGYMTDLVPSEIRGRYFSTRSAVSTVATMLVVLAYGAMLDRWPGEAGFRLLYLAAFVGAALNFGAWFLLPEIPPGERRSIRPFLASIMVPLSKPGPHRSVTWFFAAWAFAQGMAAPFYSVALVQKLGLSFSSISLLATIASLTAIVTGPIWGRIQDRIGQPRSISILSTSLTVVPLLFLAGKVGGWPVLVAAHILQGMSASAMGLANQTLNMRLAPSEDRGSYFAFFATAAGLSGVVTSVLAGPLTTQYLDSLFIASALVSGLLSLVWRSRLERGLDFVKGEN